MQEEQVEAVLAELSRIGGKVVGNEDIEFRGTQFVIPENYSLIQAAEFLEERHTALTEPAEYIRVFEYRPKDVAYAVATVARDLFGGYKTLRRPATFFSPSRPPEVITIDVNYGETTQIPWGRIAVPMFEGEMTVTGTRSENGPVGYVAVTTQKRHAAAVEGFFKLVTKHLEESSIYRGKAITGATDPEFIDLASVDLTRVVYTEEVAAQLDANVLSMLRHADVLASMNLPLKRSVLMHGPYGTGKTLAAFRTAVEAVQHGWTFIYCRPGKDDLGEVLQTAKLYQPSVVFFEDVDVVASSGDDDAVTRMLDMFDGITAKGTRLMAIMTTNHPDRIHKGMVRPGRLDAVIEVGMLDALAIKSLVSGSVDSSVSIAEVNLDEVAAAMEGFLPAFVREAVDRAVRYAVARVGGKPQSLDTADFVHAALGLRPQLDMMNEATEGVRTSTLDAVFDTAVARAVKTEMHAELEAHVLRYPQDA